MRDLKFRAWDGHMMHNPNDCDEFDFYISCEGEIKFIEETSLGGYEPFRHFRHRQSWQVMQFTGLLDKNGVEIYEGDYLSDESFVTWCETCVGFRPMWRADDSVDICHECDGNYGWRDVDFTIIEVIGNVHQNPELLMS